MVGKYISRVGKYISRVPALDEELISFHEPSRSRSFSGSHATKSRVAVLVSWVYIMIARIITLEALQLALNLEEEFLYLEVTLLNLIGSGLGRASQNILRGNVCRV